MNESVKINLGDKVRNIYNGYTGWVHGRSTFITGCDQLLVNPRKMDKDGKPVDGIWFDILACELVKEENAVPQNDRGGPSVGEAAGMRSHA